MKGLLKNNFYGMTDSVKVAASLLLVLGAVLALLGDASLVGIFPFIPAPLLAVLVVFSIWWALRAIRRAEPA